MSNGAIYQEACQEIQKEDLTSPERVRVTRTINAYDGLISRHKRSNRPPLPKSIGEVHLSQEHTKYKHPDGYINDLLLADDGLGANRILIFGTI